jgi:hypothetical protein
MQAVKHVLRTPEAAAYLGLSPSTLEKFRLSGEGRPYHKSGPKIVVYRPDDLDRWLHEGRRTSTSDPGQRTRDLSARHAGALMRPAAQANVGKS